MTGIDDPDEVWQRVRAMEAARDGILRRVRAGEATPERASAEMGELLWALPREVRAMGLRWEVLRRAQRAEREERPEG